MEGRSQDGALQPKQDDENGEKEDEEVGEADKRNDAGDVGVEKSTGRPAAHHHHHHEHRPMGERRTSQGLVLMEQCIEGLNHKSIRPSVSFSLSSSRHSLGDLDPPLSRRERRRDEMLEKVANNKWILYANCLVFFLVVLAGAMWFFFQLGWQTLCSDPSPTDCEPRNTIYNVSIHALTVLFTWMSAIVMPWRWAHTLHTLGWSRPYRNNDVGCDLYGLAQTNDPWFHVPKHKRAVILFFLMFNCFFQFANQVARGIYWEYEESQEFPGNLWTNVFFVLSLAWALIGALLFWKHTSIVRQTDKARFGPGPIEMMQEMWATWRNKNKGTDGSAKEEPPSAAVATPDQAAAEEENRDDAEEKDGERGTTTGQTEQQQDPEKAQQSTNSTDAQEVAPSMEITFEKEQGGAESTRSKSRLWGW